MKRYFFLTCLALACALPVAAQQYTIKFATLAPEGSTWLKVMRDFDKAVRGDSGGRLGFKLYPGGVAGDEKDVIRKIRLGQYNGGGFTGIGIGEIAKKIRILDAPLLFRNYDEVDFIIQKCDVKHILVVQDLPADAELFRHKPHSSNTAAFAVSAIVHLARRLVNMLARHGLTAAKTDDAAAALFGLFPDVGRIVQFCS